VHAETDLEALVEGGVSATARAAAREAEVIVRVDWERTDQSVDRVIHALVARGVIAADQAGG
jgi:hypothetical protein